MITDAAQGILARQAEAYTREILDYLRTYSDNRITRDIFATRSVGAGVSIDVITEYKRSGKGAIIAAKGVVPSGSGTTVGETKHDIVQILDGFDLHKKDISLDPKGKARIVDLCTRNIYIAEDELTINGDTNTNITGIVDAVPSTNKITTSTNNGAWNNSDGEIDIYQDILDARAMLDTKYPQPDWILGNPTDMNYLDSMDSQRVPYWKSVMGLFPKAKKKADFMKMSDAVTAGNVYLGVKHPLVAELAISENIYVVAIPMQRGEIYPIEIKEWVVPEIHNKDCFVEIATG